MADLSIDFLGLRLQNPIIAGSSTLTNSLDNIKKLSDLNIGAIILKSLFEEILSKHSSEITNDFHPESYNYNFAEAAVLYGSTPYLNFISEAKKVSKSPIIASVNCLGKKWWIDFSKSIEDAGADALELNISYVPFSPDEDPRSVEEKYFSIVNEIKSKTKMPLLVKIGHFFTNIPYMVKKIKEAGADGVTLFNRYYRVGIDLEKKEYKPANIYSSKEEAYSVIRWVVICSSCVDVEISASTGVHDADTALQYIAAGAKTVQVVSKLYEDGLGSVKELIDGINCYLDKNNIENITDVFNKVSIKDDAHRLERLQYMKIASNKLF